MQGIILNTIEEFNSLNESLASYVRNSSPRVMITKWAEPIIGTDNTYLMIVDSPRLAGFDFSSYNIQTISNENEIYFQNDAF